MEGERELQLHFPARGNPPAIKYLFSKNGVPLPAAPKPGSRLQAKGHTLLVKGATRDDRGVYSVRASNTEGSTEHTFAINILCKCAMPRGCDSVRTRDDARVCVSTACQPA